MSVVANRFSFGVCPLPRWLGFRSVLLSLDNQCEVGVVQLLGNSLVKICNRTKTALNSLVK
jgi:hypothetical protein